MDTNVVLRFLVEDRVAPPPQFAGVFAFFLALEGGTTAAQLPPLVLFQSYFVLTSYYEVPPAEAASKLLQLFDLQGLEIPERQVLRSCLGILSERPVDLVDAYLAALCRARGSYDVYSYDEGLRDLGLNLLPITGGDEAPAGDGPA